MRIPDLRKEGPIVVSSAGLLLWMFAGLSILSGNPGFADIFALSGYWLLFTGIIWLSIEHFFLRHLNP